MTQPSSQRRLPLALLTAVLTLTGCSQAVKLPDFVPTSQREALTMSLETAYELLNEGKLIEALVDYRRVANATRPGAAAHRQALAGIVLVHMAGGNNPVYDTEKALAALDQLHQALTVSEQPVSPADGLLFNALRQMLESELEAGKTRQALDESSRQKAALLREKRQLEEALAKLRRLSLE